MISLHYTSHTKAYNTIYTACNIVEAIYSFTPVPVHASVYTDAFCHTNWHENEFVFAIFPSQRKKIQRCSHSRESPVDYCWKFILLTIFVCPACSQ